ncbi:MAG: hypothetical protein JSS62_03975 [Verrucomicrobia bacterium]|nr:hypothetical protein [Verrucomicrobiota bacterium]MBS0647071.1 hypothetical protein [Verrucomicrobiota bacterium]
MSLNPLSPGFAVPDFNLASPGFGSQSVLQDEPTERNVAEDVHAAGMFAIAAVSQQAAQPVAQSPQTVKEDPVVTSLPELNLFGSMFAEQSPQAVKEDPVATSLPELNLFGSMFAEQSPQAVDKSQKEILRLSKELEFQRRRADNLQARLQRAANFAERLFDRVNNIESAFVSSTLTIDPTSRQPMKMAPCFAAASVPSHSQPPVRPEPLRTWPAHVGLREEVSPLPYLKRKRTNGGFKPFQP